jgi:agmatinase
MFYASNTFVSYNYPLKEADVAFLGIPFASTSISKNSLYGPVMVRESLKLVEDFINEVNLFEKLKICDLGDLEVVPGSYELTAKRIKETIQDVLSTNKKAFLIFIGGEHSITLPIAEALKPKTIIQLDAHADLRKDYLENKYTHQAWAYHASKLAKIIQIGVITMNKEEKALIKKGDIKSFSVNEFLKKNIKLEKPVHLTIDVDVFDPSYVETGLPEGRLKPEEVFSLLEKIDCNSMDIVEIADDRLPSKSGFLAAEIIKRVLAKKIEVI